MIRIWSMARLFAINGDGTLYQATQWAQALGIEPLTQEEARLLVLLAGKFKGETQ